MPGAFSLKNSEVPHHLNFQYGFISNASDEKIYTQMLNRYYQRTYGYTVHDRPEIYGGYHSTLLCKLGHEIIGGLSAYINDGTIGSRLPIERQGISLSDYTDISNIRYAEISRAYVLPEYRRYRIYSSLVRKLILFLTRIQCRKSVWIATRHSTAYYEMELIQLGMTARVLGEITLKQYSASGDVDVTYYLSECDLLTRKEF